MEIKINIAAILKDKPQGTKLYDWLHNIDVELDTISTTDTETVVWCTNETNNNTTCHRGYSEFGTERGYPDGLQILFPSKEMRDWSKFAWKKGDVLVSKHGTKEVIFDGFDDDYYVTFKGKHALETIEGESEYKGESDDGYNYFYTENYYLESEDAAQTYINTLEKILGGKLNRETLEIEKQTEFKDGDIAFADYGNRQNVFVVSDKTDLSEGYSSFISLDLSSLTLSMGCRISFFKKDLCKLRLATEEEKKQFFSALEKEGKRWDSDKKAIVDLKPKVELKPFDKVLVRDFGSQAWQVSLFGYKDSDFYYCCNGCGWNQCIPYNEETAHLLGTTGEWKGGEG
ncbi:MAG: hypothetical protein ACLT5T_00670 [Segatella copri]|jgi:hypothetical protein